MKGRERKRKSESESERVRMKMKERRQKRNEKVKSENRYKLNCWMVAPHNESENNLVSGQVRQPSELPFMTKNSTKHENPLPIYDSRPPPWVPPSHQSADIGKSLEQTIKCAETNARISLGHLGFHPPYPEQVEDILSETNVKSGFVLSPYVQVWHRKCYVLRFSSLLTSQRLQGSRRLCLPSQMQSKFVPLIVVHLGSWRI